MTADKKFVSGKESHHILHAYVESEAQNNEGTNQQYYGSISSGDALAVCLMEMRQLQSEGFCCVSSRRRTWKKKKLLLRVKDMLDTTHKPMVTPDASIKKVIMEISEKRLGVTAVVENNQVIGIVTDGDIRRMLNNRDTFADLTAQDIMTKI